MTATVIDPDIIDAALVRRHVAKRERIAAELAQTEAQLVDLRQQRATLSKSLQEFRVQQELNHRPYRVDETQLRATDSAIAAVENRVAALRDALARHDGSTDNIRQRAVVHAKAKEEAARIAASMVTHIEALAQHYAQLLAAAKRSDNTITIDISLMVLHGTTASALASARRLAGPHSLLRS